MKLQTWGAAALAACLVAASANSLHAQHDEMMHADESEGVMGDMAPSEFDSHDSYGSCETCPTGCSSGSGYGGMGGGLMGGLTNRPVQVIFGAEYIYAQATFSEALAFVEQDAVEGSETFNNIDFDYEDSYSFYGGVYLPDCGGAVIFDYTRLESHGDFAANETAFTNIFAGYEVEGDVEGFADVDLESYDLSFSKTIPLGCLMTAAECCDDVCCGDGCNGGCGWCPAWDITWSGGVRYAEVDWQRGAREVDGPFFDSSLAEFDFEGFGGRVGLMGRRYIGKRGLFSVYAKGDWSVLLGEFDLEVNLTRQGVGSGINRTSNDITVPVTEIELGGSTHLGEHATLSAGYFWSAWHDLGMSNTFIFDQFQTSLFDDANILGWNGFFARAEVAF